MQDAAHRFNNVQWWQVALVLLLAAWPLSPAGFGLFHWNLHSGLIFALAWLLPWRLAWAVALFAGLGSALTRPIIVMLTGDAELTPGGDFLHFWNSAYQLFIGNFADPLLALLPVWWLRSQLGQATAATSLYGVALLHAAALVSAVLMTVTDVLWVYDEGFVADMRRGSVVNAVTITADNALLLVGTFSIKNGLGYFLGIMLVSPALLWLAEPSLRSGAQRVLREAAGYLVPVCLLFLMMVLAVSGTKMAELLRLLLLVAVAVFAMREGWRGAVLSVLVVSIALAIEDHFGVAPVSPIWLQMFVAIAGAMSLMFGATVDGLRAQTQALERAGLEQLALTRELAEAAARSVRAEEAERGRIAMDLHDSLGQGITALQTQIKLAELDRGDAARVWTLGMRELVDGMREGVRDVLEALRPSALRELGLVKSIDLGALRQMAERAGVRFDVEIVSPPGGMESVDDAAAVSVYRIVQEAMTNALRHGRSTTIRLRLRFGLRRGASWIVLSVEDDGVGVSPSARPGRGIQGMRDRAMTLGGGLRLRPSRSGGTEVRAWLRASPS